MKLKERAWALQIFDDYEQAVFLLEAAKHGDYETITKTYYTNNVLSDKNNPLKINMDTQGPFY